MAKIFDPEGAGANQGAAKKGHTPESRPYPTGEGPRGQYMQYDNEMGAMMLELPPRFAKYKGELAEDIMDAFYGASAGGKPQHATIEEWIADWIARKEEEDPDLRRDQVDA